MKARQSERLKSHRTRHSLLVNSPAVAGRKALARQVAAYGRQLAVIDRLIATQSTRVSPALAGRDAIFAEMVSAALVISGLVRSYADEHEVPGLDEQVRLVASDFSLARFCDRVQLARLLYDAVLPLVPRLAELDLTPEMMEDLRVKTDAAKESLPVLQGIIIEKQATTPALVEALGLLHRIEKERIFPLLLPLQKSAPEFYRRYLIAREVHHRRRTRAQPAETETEIETGPASATAPQTAPEEVTALPEEPWAEVVKMVA